ncbi:MAG: dihydroorotase [Candidatus Limnocylindrales bacterium]
MSSPPRPGQRCERLELEDAWLVDPASGREGRAGLLVEDGHIAAVTWARGRAAHVRPRLLVIPGLTDLHAHLREPGDEDAETIASGLAAAAHGGFTTVCAMANTEPPIDGAAALRDQAARAAAAPVPVRLLGYGAITQGRAGERLAALGELADAGAIGFSDDVAPVDDPALFRHALEYAGGLDRPIMEHAELTALTKGAEAHEGLPATILGLKGWPRAAEEGAVARALTLLDDVVRAAPPGCAPRLHVTHVSTADSLILIALARESGLPVTCDVTPHHLALHEGWVGGDRRFAWEAARRPWAGGAADEAPYDPNTRVNPPLRTPADALALWAGLANGIVDAIATDHAPHREVDKLVEYGDAARGISGLETALGVLLEGVVAGLAELGQVVAALTVGPARVLSHDVPGLAVGAVADLVVVDREARWQVEPANLRSRGRNTPLLGRTLPGRVLLTVARGRFAFVDDELA